MENQTDNNNNNNNLPSDLIQMSKVNEAADLNDIPVPVPQPVPAPSQQYQQIQPGGIKEFIAQTTMIGNVIAAAASQKNSSEPLPFTDYSLFEETYDSSKLSININPNAQTKYVFLPKTPILVAITAERKHGAHIFHPWSYLIKFKHGKYVWQIVRSYKDIKEIHKLLAKIVKGDLGRSCADISKENIRPDWPEFPTEHDHLVVASQIDDRCKKLAEYLQRLLTYPPFRDHEAVVHFLGVSPLSFVRDLSQSLIEDFLYKRTGDNVYYGHLSQLKICCEKAKIFHAKRWFLVKDTYIVYTNVENNNSVGFVMLIDRGFKIKMGIKAGAYHGIEIRNLQRSLVLKCKNATQQLEWFDKINLAMHKTGNCFFNSNLLYYDSFAPARANQLCKWFLNGEGYMEAVMNGLNNAKEEIFITDWWLCPELFLKRPTEDLQYRLDKILLKKAKEGVKIYILLFKELSLAIGLESSRAKSVLTQNGKNPNIKILRHPEHSPAGVFLWSHHEKCVIIDQSVAFTGGIDLCFGRWDDDMHRLVDLGRKENIIEIDESHVEKNHLLNIVNEMNSMNVKNENEIEIETEIETEINNDKNNQLEKTESNLRRLHKQKDQIELQQIKNPQLKSEALIVAALMGNSIVKLNKNRTRLLTQQSSPPAITLTPPSSSDPTNTAASNPSLNNGFFKSLSSQSQQTTTFGNNNNFNDINTATTEIEGSANTTSNKQASAITTTTTTTTSDKNTKFSNNTTNNRTSSRAINANSKALKYISNASDINDLGESGEENNNNPSKKQMVKRKWNQIKNTVKSRSHRHPLHLRRRRSEDSNYEDDEEYDEEYIDKNYNEDPDPKLPVISNEGYYWIGKDYANTYTADFKDIADFSSDQFDREETPRMPWRDEALVIFGDSARDLARHFIQRWNQCKREKVRQIQSYPFLLPKSYADPYNYKYQDWFKDSLFRCNVQITRSLDSWSGGINQTETSIQNAYCEMIKNSEHFIYIENQFFVTTTDPDKDTYVKNKIGFELVQRIKKAHKQNKKFRVYVVLPLLPGFDSFNAIQAVQYFNLRSIRLGEYSIYNELKKEGISDPTEYITFHGMRNWSVLMGKLVQEIIYVHSKLMIVDDKYVICGSANINDRSLLGKRDSEIACIIKDEEFFDSILDGKKCKVGKYAHTLRKKIFKLHLGIYFKNDRKIEVKDCVCDEFYKLFRTVSKTNTCIYDEVFKCLPSDNVLNFEDLNEYSSRQCLNRKDPKKGKEKLDEINGFLVDFPLLFLSQEGSFFPEINTKEGMAPIAMWT